MKQAEEEEETQGQKMVESGQEVEQEEEIVRDRREENSQDKESICLEGDTPRKIATFKLCGDNIDKSVKRRYMRSDKGNLSLHYFHSYAVMDRIDVSDLSDEIVPRCLPNPDVIARSLLPSAHDDSFLKQNFAVLVSRVLAKHFAFFSFTFEDSVRWHIQHEFSDQMAKKSTAVSNKIIAFTKFELLINALQVPLGVLCKNENKSDDMVAIMTHLHQYVPSIVSDDSESIYKSSSDVQFHKIFIGGDQLTAARARHAKKHMMNAHTPQARLEGLEPMIEDWHTKACLLGVSYS